MPEAFSDRGGYRARDAEITVREDAPPDLRCAILQIAKKLGMGPDSMREVVCGVLLRPPDPNNWSPYPNIWEEANRLIEECEWFKVYDIAEEFYIVYEKQGREQEFAERLNRFFRERGIGWELRDGQIMFRGSEPFAESTTNDIHTLEESGRATAAKEIREAWGDISHRPEPDITGAIQHAMAALEAVARDVTGKPGKTLGQVVRELDLPKPLDGAVEKLWGYASQRGRHVLEGQSIDRTEAALLVSVAGAVCAFLAERNRAAQPENPWNPPQGG